jgi:hypothetical protein
MDERIKFFVGLDVQTLLRALSKYGAARQVSVVYEAGPTG